MAERSHGERSRKPVGDGEIAGRVTALCQREPASKRQKAPGGWWGERAA